MTNSYLPNAIKGVVDRLDDHQAVIQFGPGETITLPANLLPSGSVVGSSVVINIMNEQQAEQANLDQSKALLDHLLTSK